ncbi:hypothetical protein [Mycobacterium lepromatosis]|uniref:hypothetical protein n=1 Tax=Mycobacterium lepromatosis TaxID=480418 RepID=UPI00138E04ED|nr:hypothetical protein [Mycobacterium lepromatosis]
MTHNTIVALMRAGHVLRAWLSIAGSQVPVPPVVVNKLGVAHSLQVSSVVPGSRPS